MSIPLPVRIAVTAFAPVFVVLWIVAEAGRSNVYATVVFAVLMAVAIALAPWRPWFAVILASAIPVAELAGLLPSLTNNDWPILFGGLIPVACAGFALTGRRRLIALGIGLLGVLAFTMSLLGLLPSDLNLADRLMGRDDITWDWIMYADMRMIRWRLAYAGIVGLFGTILVVSVWAGAAGLAARIGGAADRTARLRAEADLAGARLEQAVVGERARIAREVHDATAHSLAIVVAQADGALAEGTPGAADVALGTIAETGRRALAEMRGLLERIDGEGPALGA